MRHSDLQQTKRMLTEGYMQGYSQGLPSKDQAAWVCSLSSGQYLGGSFSGVLFLQSLSAICLRAE